MDTNVNYLTTDQVARRFSRSPRTIRRWLRAGVMPSFRLRGTHFVDERDLVAFCDRLKHAAAE